MCNRPSSNVKAFFEKFDQLTEAETFFLAHKSYIDSDNVLRQIVCSLTIASSSTFISFFFSSLLYVFNNEQKEVKAAGIAASEQFYGTLIRRCSAPVTLELGGALTKKQSEAETETENAEGSVPQQDAQQQAEQQQQQRHFSQYTIEPRIVEELKITARKMASIGVTSCASTYATHRVNFVLGSLGKMNMDPIKAVTESVSAASQYVAHSHPVFAYAKTLLSVLSFERDFAEDILSHQFRTVWGQIVEPVFEQFIRTVERAERSVSSLCADNPGRIYRYGFFIVADAYDAFHSSLDKMDVITRLEVNKHSEFMDNVEASQKKQVSLLVKAVTDFLALLQLEQAPSAEGMVKQTFPRDGTVHEVTALVCISLLF